MEITITKENFDNEVRNYKGTVLLDFWADWCGPCMMLSPIISEIAEELDERLVGDVRGGNLEHRHEGIEKSGALHIEGCGKESDANLITVACEFLEFILPERIVFLEKLILALCRFLRGVPVSGGILGSQRAGLVGLEFDGVRAAFLGFPDKAFGKLHTAFVVHASLGDDVRHGDAGLGCDVKTLEYIHKTPPHGMRTGCVLFSPCL